MYCLVIKGENDVTLKLKGHTMAVKIYIQILGYRNIDATQQALIPLLGALIEDLNCYDRRIFDHAERWS